MNTIKKEYLNEVIFIIIVLIVFVSSLGTSYGSFFRYIKYLIPIIVILPLIIQRKISLNKLLLNNLKLYLLLLFLNFCVLILTNKFSTRFFEECVLIIFPLLTALLVTSFNIFSLDNLIIKLFYSYVIVFVITNFKHLINLAKLISKFPKALIYSEFPTESWIAFPISIFTLYFFIEKKYKLFFFSSIIFLLSFKRIAMFSMLIAILFYVIYFNFFNKKFSRKIIRFFFILNILLLTILYNFISGNFSKLIFKYTGLSVNWLSQGRFQIYNETIIAFKNKIIYGGTLGSTNIYLSKRHDDIELIHSDILKLIIELGIISFLIWMFYFFSINIVNKKTAVLVLYLNILFMTDNVFIYFDTLFIFYLLLAKFKQQDGL